jgi:hypothetical protein
MHRCFWYVVYSVSRSVRGRAGLALKLVSLIEESTDALSIFAKLWPITENPGYVEYYDLYVQLRCSQIQLSAFWLKR